jgi:hypothetical protein
MKPQLCPVILVVAVFLSFSPMLSAADVALAWDPVSASGLAGYQVGYSSVSGQYTTTVNVGNVTAYTVPSLASGTYYFAVRACDTAGQFSAYSNEVTASIASAADTTPPVISAVGSSGIMVSSATISWTTNEASDSQVEYGTTATYGSSTALSSSMVTSHSQALSGLAAATLYHYRVRSKDAAGNQAVSGDYTFTTAQSIDITTGLAAAYAFDEGSGSSSADFSGNANSATIYSGTWITGKYGKALSFNGTSSYLSAGVNQLPGVSQPKTISCWIYFVTKPRTLQTILALANPSLRASVQYGYKSTQAGVLGYGNTWVLVARLPSIKTWHHFGYVFDGTKNSLYIDGVLTSTSTIMPPTAAVTSFQIGRWITASQYFKGYIDNVRIYNRALTLQELKAAMNTPVGSSSTAKDARAASEEEALPDAGKEELELQPAAQPSAAPTVDIELEQWSHRKGDTVSTAAFRIANPSDQGRDVEVKTWMELPGMPPLSLDLSETETLTLEPGSHQDCGSTPLMKVTAEKISGTGEANARLIDPVTGDVLAEDFNAFSINRAAAGRRSKDHPDLPHIALEDFAADSGPQYRISNKGAEAAAIEFKVWIEAPDGGTTPVFSIGADGSLVLDAGSELTLDPLTWLRIPAGSFVVRARVLDAASGATLCER